MLTNQWLPAPPHLALSPTDVHVWAASLQFSPRIYDSLQKTLSEDELLRASRFKFDKDRQAFTSARGILRNILAKYLTIRPEAVTFHYAEHGKPEINPALNPLNLSFNISHTEGIALYAITLNRMIGIDIELIRDNLADNDIAKRFFSDNEYRALQKLSSEVRSTAFFHCWTQKEAFVKAMGKGLSFPLKNFDVAIMPEEAKLIAIDGNPKLALDWQMRTFFPTTNSISAVAVYGKPGKWQLWRWLLVN